MSLIFLEQDGKDLNISDADIIYSKGYSRPSKSIITPDIYNAYKSIKDPCETFSNVKHAALIECLNYEFCNVVNVSKNLYSLDGEFYSIIYFTDSKFAKVTKAINSKYTNYVIVLNDIYTYPKIQYIYILSKYFSKIVISMSKMHNFVTVICKNRRFLLELNIKETDFVKDFNVKVEDSLLKDLKQDNDSFMKNNIITNKKINNICKSLSQISNLNREIYTISKYYNAFVNKECNINCNCKPNSIFYSDILECYICENCLVLTSLFLTI